MNFSIILAHPNEASSNHAIAHTCQQRSKELTSLRVSLIFFRIGTGKELFLFIVKGKYLFLRHTNSYQFL